ncbi:hypothetical protein CVIRNUC_010780 [Coccomyxa viridis]|uniref:Uncharacterized protein n=1 Tax=Coccomyxa viridis TaxID=1274662 RepID=A0AAV1IND4_9CHLO|nr:hypothetical protein CVIRNUC_010780 [Coccomyxa viridis]
MVGLNEMEPSSDVTDFPSDATEGSPPHAGYEALNNGEASCGEDEEHSELDTPHMTLSQGSIAANWAHEPRQITQDTNGRSHHQPDPDCRPSIPTSALLLEKPTSEAPSHRGVDSGTLAATAQALHEQYQAADFAHWDSASASASTKSSAEGSSRATHVPGLTGCRDAQHDAKTLQQDKIKQVPKVLMVHSREDSATSLELTEEKRTAIQGAMKNITLTYMPQWAAAVPEQAWINSLKANGDS